MRDVIKGQTDRQVCPIQRTDLNNDSQNLELNSVRFRRLLLQVSYSMPQQSEHLTLYSCFFFFSKPGGKT